MNKFLLTLFVVFFTLSVSAQIDEKEKLEQRKEQLQRELSEAKTKLQNEKKKEKSVLKEIAGQEAQIKISEKIISTIAKQARILDDNIYLTQLEINKLNKDLKIMKEDYAKMIVKSYKSRSEQSRIMFVLSSNSFLQAYKRMQYMKQYAGYRKRQAEEIKIKQTRLGVAVNELQTNKKEKEVVIVEKTKIKAEHEKLKEEKVQTAKLIQKDKKKIAAEIAKMDKERKSIDKKIKKMINDAIAAENRKRKLEQQAAAKKSGTTAPVKTTPVSSTKIELTPEGKLSSDSFKANKGRLPWPVAKGYVSTGYGDVPHPDYKNIVIHNSGIDITTDPGSSAMAVFAGEVSGVQVSQTTNTYTVLVRHGDFFTAYSNLSSVSVSVGNKVTAKQVLGKIKTNAKGNSILKFVINQNTTVLNPKSWIAPR
ncbi:peptidoglycan DD-metalloendopeptidase family protein [Flavobacterium sp. F372]|uniref:Peptidoglycan DD-metalloendopeptidase family protein n=1 Tax=Flavobacterium bernardetii TaxID=2813823 RepID=A0ABR7J106_9FLAO|nr:peptidoglycan DD-metalloendopeptidase family protein [Flavobacterium bernardetii]MBC5835628.1 peptidoglycan DD-metalloendopeptidase family protein [Flavobacterium bernardetii]NHF70992.1 peptidoglycan DD-metalloendopeptidase family protein [Flavobacterium bernardetii]